MKKQTIRNKETMFNNKEINVSEADLEEERKTTTISTIDTSMPEFSTEAENQRVMLDKEE